MHQCRVKSVNSLGSILERIWLCLSQNPKITSGKEEERSEEEEGRLDMVPLVAFRKHLALHRGKMGRKEAVQADMEPVQMKVTTKNENFSWWPNRKERLRVHFSGKQINEMQYMDSFNYRHTIPEAEVAQAELDMAPVMKAMK